MQLCTNNLVGRTLASDNSIAENVRFDFVDSLPVSIFDYGIAEDVFLGLFL